NGVRPDQPDQMRHPHARRESLASDITKREDEPAICFFNCKEITRQVTNGEDFARNIKRPVMNLTRRTQTPVHLRCLEDRGIQLRIIFLQCFESFLELVNRTNRCGGHSSQSLSNKFITTAMNGKNETRLLRIRFQLLPQVNDMRVNGARGWIVFVSPHCIKQSITTQCFYRMSKEVSQQRKLFRREINHVSVAFDFVTTNVDLDVAELVNLRRCNRR